MRIPARALLPFVVVLLVGSWRGPLESLRANPVDPAARALQEACDDLAQLRRLARQSRTVNDGLLQYLEAVGDAHGKIATRGKEAARFRRQAEDVLLQCLVLEKASLRRNLRDDVNNAAARVLGETAPFLDAEDRALRSRRMMQAVETYFLKVKAYDVSRDVLEAIFTALARLGAPEAIPWILDVHVHTNENKIAFLLTAHESLRLYKSVPGPLRYTVVKTFLRTYAPIEMFASRDGAGDGGVPRTPRDMMAQRLWEKIGRGVIAVVRYYAVSATGSYPPRAATMQQFESWFRRHRDPRQPPWADPKPVPAR